MNSKAYQRRALVAAIVLAAASPGARAETFPVRPLTLVVPLAAGGAADGVARILAAGLSQTLGQPVIVDNIGGAGGMVGAARVAKAPPDGYELLLGSSGSQALSQTIYRKPLYRAVTDFTPVTLVTEQPIVLVARKDLPADNLAEFVRYARTNQARMQFGSAGAGSGVHLACLLLNGAIGVEVAHIPYRGGALAMQDLIAGRIDYQCAVNTAALPQLESRTIKSIAVLSRERSPSLPGIATAEEQGYEVHAGTWYALFLPKDTPAEIVRTMHAAATAALDMPRTQARLREIGADPVAPERRSSDYLQRFVESEIEKWAAPVKAAGLVSE